MVDPLLARKSVTADMRIRHAAGPVEPLLRVADAVVGAVVAARCGNAEHVARLTGLIQVIEIDP